MKRMISLFLLTTSATAFAAYPLAAKYEPILVCEEANGAPQFEIGREGGVYYLSVKSQFQAKRYELESSGADYGYMSYELADPRDLGDLESYVGTITITNDEEDIEDPEQAVHTGGYISSEQSEDQPCEAIGETRVNP